MFTRPSSILHTLFLIVLAFTWLTAEASLNEPPSQILSKSPTPIVSNTSSNKFPLLTKQDMGVLVGCSKALVNSLPDDISINECNASQPLYIIQKNHRYGFINSNGQIVIKPIYDRAWPFREDRAKVYQDGKYGFIDKTGQLVIDLKYDDAGDFNEGLAMVEQNGKIGYINRVDQTIIPFIYEPDQSEFSNDFIKGFVEVNLAGKKGVIDKHNKVVIPFIYDWIDIITEDNDDVFFNVELEDKEGLLDSHGKTIISLEFDRVSLPSEGLIAVGNLPNKQNTKEDDIKGFGYFNTSGELVIPFNYDYAGPFINGMAEVQLNDKKGLINSKGDLVVPMQYSSINHSYLAFDNANALPVATEYNHEFLIDKHGHKISEVYDKIDPFYGKLAAAYREYDDELSTDKELESFLLNDKGEVVRRASPGNFFISLKTGKLQGYFIEVSNTSSDEGGILISPYGEVLGKLPDFVLPSV